MEMWAKAKSGASHTCCHAMVENVVRIYVVYVESVKWSKYSWSNNPPFAAGNRHLVVGYKRAATVTY